MERKEVEKVVKETIFEKMGEEMEKKTGKCIPDEVLNVKPYYKLTVGELINMLYNYLKDYEKR